MRGNVRFQRCILFSFLGLQGSRAFPRSGALVNSSSRGYRGCTVSSPSSSLFSHSHVHHAQMMRPQHLQQHFWQYSRRNSSDSKDSPVEKVECIVIGAGVVGLAVARKLAMMGHEVVVIESDEAIGTGTSSRNSEVIHAGIYYPPGSLKAKLCVQGRMALYNYCLEHGVPHRACGKLIVATSKAQVSTLERLWERGKANGVGELCMISAEAAREMEPELHCVQALLSPVTGILDSHSFMLTLQGEAEDHGAVFAFNSTVVSGAVKSHGICINVADTKHLRSTVPAQRHIYSHPIPTSRMANGSAAAAAAVSELEGLGGFDDHCQAARGMRTAMFPLQEEEEEEERGRSSKPSRVPMWMSSSSPLSLSSSFSSLSLEARMVVNCGGLDALPIARRICGVPQHVLPMRHLARGCYFALAGGAWDTSHIPERLIYPVPEDGGLGVHLTIDLGGQLKFGPDVEWLGSDTSHDIFTQYDYGVDPTRSSHFYPQVSKYLPNLPEACLRPDYAGIRPKLSGPAQPDADFLIQGEAEHGVKGLVNLFGIESPGLTASLAIADYVYSILTSPAPARIHTSRIREHI